MDLVTLLDLHNLFSFILIEGMLQESNILHIFLTLLILKTLDKLMYIDLSAGLLAKVPTIHS